MFSAVPLPCRPIPGSRLRDTTSKDGRSWVNLCCFPGSRRQLGQKMTSKATGDLEYFTKAFKEGVLKPKGETFEDTNQKTRKLVKPGAIRSDGVLSDKGAVWSPVGCFSHGPAAKDEVTSRGFKGSRAVGRF